MESPKGTLPYRLIYELGNAFASRLELVPLIELVTSKCREVLDADGVAVMLLDAGSQELYFPYFSDRDPKVAERLARVRVPHDPRKGEFGIFRSLRQTAREIVEAAGEPRVVFAKPVHAKRDEFFREEFCQGGSYRFEVRTGGDKVHIGLNGVTRGRKDAIARECLCARQTGGFDEA